MIRESHDVAAPADLVHDLLTDVAAWPLWSPHVLWTDPPDGRVGPGWQGRVRPWFGPATTMHVTHVAAPQGMRWRTTALGHELRYAHRVVATGPRSCEVEFTAEVHGPAARWVERLVGPLSAFGQRRRLQRLGLLAERLARR